MSFVTKIAGNGRMYSSWYICIISQEQWQQSQLHFVYNALFLSYRIVLIIISPCRIFLNVAATTILLEKKQFKMYRSQLHLYRIEKNLLILVISCSGIGDCIHDRFLSFHTVAAIILCMYGLFVYFCSILFEHWVVHGCRKTYCICWWAHRTGGGDWGLFDSEALSCNSHHTNSKKNKNK